MAQKGKAPAGTPVGVLGLNEVHWAGRGRVHLQVPGAGKTLCGHELPPVRSMLWLGHEPPGQPCEECCELAEERRRQYMARQRR